MAKLDITYDILQDSPASASPVEANFNKIEQHINQEVIERSGTVAMTGQLRLAGDPQAPLDATSKQYVDSILPIGIMMLYGGAAVPPGGKWAICNGAELESALWPELFAVIGTTYSIEGTPAGRFNLPNLVDRFAVGQGSIAALGKTGGSRDPVVTKHSHQIDHGHPYSITTVEDRVHQHQGIDHLHAVNGNTGGQSANHVHAAEVPGGQFMLYGVGGEVKAGSGTSIPFVGPYNTAGATTDHTHRVDLWSSPSDRNLLTGGQSVNHQHGVTIATHTGRSGDEGVTGTNANLPPFVAVNYIIRAK